MEEADKYLIANLQAIQVNVATLDQFDSQTFINCLIKCFKHISKMLNDEDNFMPNTDYSVTLDFKKEFIRHKRIICSLKTLSEFDI